MGASSFALRYSISERLLRLEPESMGSFTVQCTSRFSTPVYGRLTFRSRREGGQAAASMVFLLCTNVTSRPPVQTIECTAAVYKPVLVDVDVSNPFPNDGTFKLSVIQDNGTQTSFAVNPSQGGGGGAGAGAGAQKGLTDRRSIASRGSRRRPGQPASKKPVCDALCGGLDGV